MADYIADCRSNYVRAKNPKRFKELLSEYELQVIEDDHGRIGFISNHAEGIPRHMDDEGYTEMWVDDDPRIPKLMAEGEVLVIMEVGRESMRYLKGYAVAINWDGKVCHVSLDEIYSRAQANFGTKPSTQAEY